MIRTARPWGRRPVSRPGLCLTLTVTAALSAGGVLAQDSPLPVLPPFAAPATAAAPGASVPGEGVPGSEAAESSSADASRLLEQMDLGAEVVQPAPGLTGIPACPRDVLTRLLAAAAGRDDALSVLAIEREMLKLCHERQKVIADIYQMEAKLDELRAPGREEAEPAAAEADSLRATPALLSRLGGESAGGEVAKSGASTQSKESSGTKRPPPPTYVWFSIIGGGKDLRAGVTDGSRVWFVRVGDPLPGAGRIERIGARPPGVWIDGAEDAVLPYGPGPRPGATP